jgi:hypothetical protein
MTEPRRYPTSLAGRLEDIELPELIQFLAGNRKTGRLTLTRRDGHGVLLIRGGRILYAATNSVRETLGNLLVRRGLVDEATLIEAIETQHWAEEPKRLGEILVEKGKLDEQSLEEVVKDQTRAVVQELFSWGSGFFKFEVMPLPDREEIGVDAREFLVVKGINTDEVLLEAARQLDESGGVLPGTGPLEAPARNAAEVTREVTDLRAPALRGELTIRLMHAAAGIVRRGVLFALRGDEAHGVGHFGVPPENLPRGGRVVVSLEVPSILQDAVQRKEPQLRPFEATEGNRALRDQLGGLSPAEMLAVPMVVAGGVAILFYGDNLPEETPIGALDGLLKAADEVSLAMEKEALDERQRDFTRRYGS